MKLFLWNEISDSAWCLSFEGRTRCVSCERSFIKRWWWVWQKKEEKVCLWWNQRKRKETYILLCKYQCLFHPRFANKIYNKYIHFLRLLHSNYTYLQFCASHFSKIVFLHSIKDMPTFITLVSKTVQPQNYVLCKTTTFYIYNSYFLISRS